MSKFTSKVCRKHCSHTSCWCWPSILWFSVIFLRPKLNFPTCLCCSLWLRCIGQVGWLVQDQLTVYSTKVEQISLNAWIKLKAKKENYMAVYIKVMLQEMICNNNFQRNTAQCCDNAGMLHSSKNRCCESSRVTSPLCIQYLGCDYCNRVHLDKVDQSDSWK